MVAITEIGAALNGLNAAKTILQGLVAVRDAASLNTIKVDLQSAILDAQGSLLTAQEKQAAVASQIADLEQQIVGLKDWSAERERYELTAVSPGAFAYQLKAGVETGEPPHWLCASCFQDGKKAILQSVERRERTPSRPWKCPSCKSEIMVGYGLFPAGGA